MEEKPRVDQERLDMLRELANIGIGSATTSLSEMLQDEKIMMDVPQVEVEVLQEVPEKLGDPENMVAGVYFEAQCPEEEINLVLLFVLSMESVKNLIKRLLPDSSLEGYNFEAGEIGEMELSMVREVGNIVAGSYLNALSFVTNLTFMSTPPQLAMDMTGAIVATVIAETRMVDDELILLKTEIHSAEEVLEGAIEGNVLILPDEGAMVRIFNLMGVE